MDQRPIGIFDSGVGGLTVARAIIDLLPYESVIYFGDTARYPYGPRSQAEVRRFAEEDMDVLLAEDVKLAVVACNTASAAALDELRAAYPVPVVDVIEPTARAAVRLTRNRSVGVIGTAGTIGSGRYLEAIEATRENVAVTANACAEFVEFVERGETTGKTILDLAAGYLAPLVEAEVDTLILGCTHYPLLTGVLSYILGPDVFLVSSAEWTAREVFAELTQADLHADFGAQPRHRFLSSGDSEPPPEPVPVYGPAGWAERMAGFIMAEAPPVIEEAFQVHELRDRERVRLGPLDLTAVATFHSVETYGVRASAPGATLAYSADSGPCDALYDLADGADLFLCEASWMERPDGARSIHMTPSLAGEWAARSDVRRLVLTHLRPGADPERAAELARLACACRVDVAAEGTTFELDGTSR